MSDKKPVVLRFDDVTFEYVEKRPLMKDASFSIRENSKFALMGQNGAGKSTIFKLITGELKPKMGRIHLGEGVKVGIAKQVMAREFEEMTVEDYFATAFEEVPRNLPALIDNALEAVAFTVPHDAKVGGLSGGQKGRLLLAHSLINEPDILLLDEPTNNLDAEGIAHLIGFLMMYEKTVIVISHDADFLSTFTDGVVYLDALTKEIDQYVGDYYAAVEKITARVEAEQRKNAQLKKEIQDKKDKVNFFAHKGGKMRKLAAKLKEEVEEAEANMVRVKEDDKPISPFTIEAGNYTQTHLTLSSVGIFDNYELIHKPVDIEMRKGDRLHIKGPNGIGKTTLLERLAKRTEEGAVIPEDLKIGYYRQDFSGLDFNQTGFEALAEIVGEEDKEKIFSTAARFLLKGEALGNPIGAMSEGQKALLSFARFSLQELHMLILDEPTNHVNFRHLPIIAEALEKYEGAMILVTHDEHFLSQINCNLELDLGKLRDKE